VTPDRNEPAGNGLNGPPAFGGHEAPTPPSAPEHSTPAHGPPDPPNDPSGLPDEGSILNFTADDRYDMVHFRLVRTGDTEPSVYSCPFLGWAVQVRYVSGETGARHTRLVPVGLGDHGEAVTAWDLDAVDHVTLGRAAQVTESRRAPGAVPNSRFSRLPSRS
jgi:hypothetical protein